MIQQVQSSPLTDDELDRIEARANAATDGPWYAEEDDDCWQLFAESRLTHDGRIIGVGHPRQLIKAPKRGTPYAEYWPTDADSAFIAHARVDVPRLVAEVRRLRQELAREPIRDR